MLYYILSSKFVKRKIKKISLEVKSLVFVFLFLFLFESNLFAVGDPRMLENAKNQKRARSQGLGQPGVSVKKPGSIQKLQHMDINELLSEPAAGKQEDTLTQTQVDITRLINSFKVASLKWTEVLDQRTKEKIVSFFIAEFKKNNIIIKKDSSHYVGIIDNMSRQNPDLLNNSFDKILQIVSIIEYDFDNGQDKDLMAQKILGTQGYIRNKERLGLP